MTDPFYTTVHGWIRDWHATEIAGTVVGGAIGSALGPGGTLLGAAVGREVGNKIEAAREEIVAKEEAKEKEVHQAFVKAAEAKGCSEGEAEALWNVHQGEVKGQNHEASLAKASEIGAAEGEKLQALKQLERKEPPPQPPPQQQHDRGIE